MNDKQIFRVNQALKKLISPDDLSEEEHDHFLDRMASESTDIEESFFTKQRERGFGVGLDENDNLIYQITPQERANRQEAYDFAIASCRLEGMAMPPEAVKIMLAYVQGDITKEEEKAGILALLQ